MSDRFGPSEDCNVCGQPQSYGHFAECPVCLKTMCHCCIDNHECHDVYSNCPNCLGTGIGYSYEPNSCGWCKGRGYLLPKNEDE